jgi:hypothetical protein
VIQAEEIGPVSGVTPVAAGSGQSLEVTFAAEVSGDPTVVMELVTCPLMECTLGGTSVKHPQYYHLKVLTRPFFSSPLLLPIKLYRYRLGQLRHSQER